MTVSSEQEITGKANHRTTVISSPEKSDGGIVPEKSANNGKKFPAEWMEGRPPTERNHVERLVVCYQVLSFSTVFLLHNIFSCNTF
jgi:hypothetical protein